MDPVVRLVVGAVGAAKPQDLIRMSTLDGVEVGGTGLGEAGSYR